MERLGYEEYIKITGKSVEYGKFFYNEKESVGMIVYMDFTGKRTSEVWLEIREDGGVLRLTRDRDKKWDRLGPWKRWEYPIPAGE